MVIGGFLWWWWGWGISVLFSGLSSVCVSSLYQFPYSAVFVRWWALVGGILVAFIIPGSVSAALQSPRLHLWEQHRPWFSPCLLAGTNPEQLCITLTSEFLSQVSILSIIPHSCFSEANQESFFSIYLRGKTWHRRWCVSSMAVQSCEGTSWPISWNSAQTSSPAFTRVQTTCLPTNLEESMDQSCLLQTWMEPILYWSRVLAFSFATIYWTVYSRSLIPLDTFPVPLLSTLEQVGADVLTWMTFVLLRVLQLVRG